ncbi:MAG TPA: glycosyltransferase family 39 protein, partial [Thermoanaerobaculia bacterium]|nr:glycosyltransferase family 39 protein [Thermoanaerobaculia bacterium]
LLAAWGSRVFTPSAGWIAAALFLGYPMVAYLSVTGYVDVGVALFATAGLYALERWREEGSGGWLVLAGVFAGSAAGVKYLGLFFVAAIGLEVLLAAPRWEKVRALLLFSLVALAVLGPWYARILFYTGNPLFPFFSHLFGDTPWGMEMPGPGLRERLADLPMLPWDVLVNRQKVGWQPPFSPAFLLGIPFVLTGAVRDPRLRRLILLVAVYVLALLVLPPDVRYLTPVLPILSLVLAVELTVLGRRWARTAVTAAFCILCLLPSWGWAGYRIATHGAVPVTVEQRDLYLERQLPVLNALRFLNRTRGRSYTVYAFHAENMRHFAQGRFLGDWNGPARFDRLLPLVEEPAALWRELRKLGTDHLLVVPGKGPLLPVGDPRFRRLFRKVYFDGEAEIFALEGAPSPRISAIIRPR